MEFCCFWIGLECMKVRLLSRYYFISSLFFLRIVDFLWFLLEKLVETKTLCDSLEIFVLNLGHVPYFSHFIHLFIGGFSCMLLWFHSCGDLTIIVNLFYYLALAFYIK